MDKKNTLWKTTKQLSHFIYSARCGNTKEVIRCIDEGTDPNAIFDGTSALHIATELQNIDMILAIIIKGKRSNVNIDVNNPYLDTPLMVACQRQLNPKVIKILLKNGANPNCINKVHRTAIFFAVYNNSILAAIYLISHKAILNTYDIFGNTPLSIATIEKRFLPMVKLLLRKGANPNFCMPLMMPLLLRACLYCLDDNAVNVINYLLDHGVDKQEKDPISGQNALHIVAISCKPYLAKFLLKNKIDMYKKDISGRTPLTLARLMRCTRLYIMYNIRNLFHL